MVWLRAERFGSDRAAALAWGNEYGTHGTRWDLSVHHQLPIESSAEDSKLLCVTSSSNGCEDGQPPIGWTFSVRFGNCVFTIYYGSERNQILRDEFVENYARVFEDYIIQTMVLFWINGDIS